MKKFFYGFYWSGVWIGICFLAFAGRLFSPEAFLALFFIALVLSLPWNIFALLLGILLMMLIHPIGDFSVFGRWGRWSIGRNDRGLINCDSHWPAYQWNVVHQL